MKKLKSILFILFVVTALGTAIWAYFHLKQTKKPSLNAAAVFPENAFCIISSNNFHELSNALLNKNLIWNELISISDFKEIQYQIQYFDSLCFEIEIVKEFLEGRKINLGIYIDGTKTKRLITFNLKDMTQEKDFIEMIQSLLKVEINKEGEGEIWNGTTKMNLKVSQGVVALSEDKELLVSAFSKESKKQVDRSDYKEMIKNLDEDNLFNLFIDHQLDKALKKSINLQELVLSGISVGNIELNPDAITINGFNNSDSSSLLHVLSSQTTESNDFLPMLPFSTIGYRAMAISNYSELKAGLKIKKVDEEQFWKSANDSALFNIQTQFENNIGTKAIEVDYTNLGQVNSALLIEIKDSALVKECLQFLADTISNNQGTEIYELQAKANKLTSILFDEIFSKPYGFVFVYGNYLVLNETKEASHFYISSLLNSSSVTQNELFMHYANENLLVPFNYQHYTALNRNMSSIKKMLPFLNDSSLRAFNKFSDASISISQHKRLFQYRANLKFQSTANSNEVPGLWSCEVDTFIATKPVIFKNHKSNENEIVFQDAKNNLYLVNATGNILWKKPIGQLAMSTYYMIDAFKNNKFQILFNTAEYIHLIDRNGNYVPGYPMKLKAQATNPMALYDYENTKDYRILIACSDLKIYNYNSNGTKNDKFTPIPLEEKVTAEVKYIKVGASDYLIVTDVEGKIYVYSRRGEGRIDITNRLLAGEANYYLSVTSSIQNTKLVYLDDKNSLLESITLVDKKEIVKLNSDFENASYTFDLIDDDKKTDMIIVDKSKLLCYDLSGNEIFRFESNDEMYEKAQYFYDSDGAFFLLNTSNGEVHILNASTKKIIKKLKVNGIPIVYDLFKDGKKYILASEKNVLKCVLLK